MSLCLYFATGVAVLSSNRYNQVFTIGVGQIWLSNVQCRGTETRLTDCTHPGFGVHSCSHSQDAGAKCLTCTQGVIRLRGGNATSGRVEICNNNDWGRVCSDGWDNNDAEVACRQLGFEPTGKSIACEPSKRAHQLDGHKSHNGASVNLMVPV